jgi:hypothetical protein
LDIIDEDIDVLGHGRLRLFSGVRRVERPHVLIDIFKHSRLGFHGLSIEAEDRDLEFIIHIKRDIFPGLGISANAVLGGIKGDKLDIRVVPK